MASLTFDQVLRLALAACQSGRTAEAEALCRNLLAVAPNHPEALHLLGMAAGQAGRVDEAVALIRQAISAAPNEAHYHSNLAIWLAALKRLDEAASACAAAIALQPGHAEAHYNLGNVRMDQRRLDESISAFRTALAYHPRHANAMANLALVLHRCGNIASAIEWYRRALAIDPGHYRNHCSLVFALNYDPECDAETIARELREWNRRHAAPRPAGAPPHPLDRSPDRKLRIGYVSPDFRQHPVGRHVLVLFREHDRRQFEIVGYSGAARPDPMTARFRELAGLWRETAGLSDGEFAAQIRADRIDILVDLSLHGAGHRLRVFALKPAPVQTTFAGYPGTTGLETIDYRITDRYLDPVSQPAPYVEAPIHLPDSFWCFDPYENTPEVNPLPALTKGCVTFGSFNNFGKVNDTVLSLWARVLAGVPDSRMLILCPVGDSREAVLRKFAEHSVERRRVAFVESANREAYLAFHHRVDLILDTFPYTGHSTTCEALWMGVPVVSLAGATTVSRGGLSILSNVGLPELVATDPEAFLRIASELSRDLPKLAALRASLRSKMRESPLMDAPRFTRHVEAAFRTMWQRLDPSARADPL